MELKYTPTTINEIEVANNNKSFTVLLGDIRLKMLALWVKKGLGLQTDKEAFEKIEEYLKENTIKELMIEIFEALQKGGFLDKDKDIRELISNAEKEATEDPKKAQVPQTL